MGIDLWSAGCIYAELLGLLGTPVKQRGPLFPGRSCFPLSPDTRTDYRHHVTGKHDMLNKIFDLIGTPTDARSLLWTAAKPSGTCRAMRSAQQLASGTGSRMWKDLPLTC